MSSRAGLLTEFSVRLEQMNATQRRLALHAIDAPALAVAERVAHMRVLLDAIDDGTRNGRPVDERLIVDLGAHALGWLDAHRSGGPPVLRVVEEDPVPVVPRDGGPQNEFMPGDRADWPQGAA